MTQKHTYSSSPEEDVVPVGTEAVTTYFSTHAPRDLAAIGKAQCIYYANAGDSLAQDIVVMTVAQSLPFVATADPGSVPRIAVWVYQEGGKNAQAPATILALGSASSAFGSLLAGAPEKAMNLALWAEPNLPPTFRPTIEYVLTQGEKALRPDDLSPLARDVRARCTKVAPCPYRGLIRLGFAPTAP